MPVGKPVLKTMLSQFMFEDNPNFQGFPADIFESATLFSEAIKTGCSTIIPTSISVIPAAFGFYNNLINLSNTSTKQQALIQFKAAFASFATTFASGTTGFVSTPPVTPIPIDSLFNLAVNNQISGDDYLDALCDIIVNWFKTGISVNIASGATINWN